MQGAWALPVFTLGRIGAFSCHNSWPGIGKRCLEATNGPGRSGIANPYTFTGRRYDDETGLYYYRNRYYSAELGRFVSRDPIGYEGRSNNLYDFLHNNPLSNVDPDGRLPVCCTYCKDGKMQSDPVDCNLGSITGSPSKRMVRCCKNEYGGRIVSVKLGCCNSNSGVRCPKKTTMPGVATSPCGQVGSDDQWRVAKLRPPLKWTKPTIWFCYFSCLGCNSNRSQPNSACQACVDYCHKKHTALCKKDATCQLAALRTKEFMYTMCDTLGGSQ